MKFSSIPLIAVTFAGSTFASPGALHARALEDVHSFIERNVAIYSRESGLALLERKVNGGFVDLFARQARSGYVRTHQGCDEAAEALEKAAADQRIAAGTKYKAGLWTCSESERQELHRQHANHLAMAADHDRDALKYRKNAKGIRERSIRYQELPSITKQWRRDKKRAKDSSAYAMQSTRTSLETICTATDHAAIVHNTAADDAHQ